MTTAEKIHAAIERSKASKQTAVVHVEDLKPAIAAAGCYPNLPGVFMDCMSDGPDLLRIWASDESWSLSVLKELSK